MNRSLKVNTPGVNWRDGQAMLYQFMEELLVGFAQEMERQLQGRLDAETDSILGRGSHARRAASAWSQSTAICQRCGTHKSRAFSRNGHRQRSVQTTLGSLKVWYPRVVCECGGSVHLPLSLLGRYQRFFGDIDAQITQYAAWGLSLRQMKQALSDMLCSEVGLARLNACVQAVRQPLAGPLSSVAPILLLDAIWVSLLKPTGQRRCDRLGRVRAVKVKHKVALLVALALWPTGKWEVLDWSLANGEDHDSWQALLVRLESRGVYAQRGLRLILHDGNAALMAALEHIYPHVPHQRCLFHKFRNLWQAIILPQPMDCLCARAFKRQLMQQLKAIFYAPTHMESLRRRDEFCRQWATTQSALVACLLRHWNHTVTFFRLHVQFPNWSLLRLRTTSVLERVNRLLRRLFRAAGAFHSEAGLLACAARVLAPLRAI